MKAAKRNQKKEESKLGATTKRLSKVELDVKSKELIQLWQQEIEGLTEEVFSSFDEAVFALIDKVMDKVSTGVDGKEESRKFLYEFLTADPHIEKEIRDLLKIR